MKNEKCATCAEPCPMADMAHEAAKGRMYAINEFINLLKKAESGKLVEVVRCKDCRLGDPDLSLKGTEQEVFCNYYDRDCYFDNLGMATPKCSECPKCNLTRPPQSWCYVEEFRT